MNCRDHGNGLSVNIIEGAGRAYLKALNKALAERSKGRGPVANCASVVRIG